MPSYTVGTALGDMELRPIRVGHVDLRAESLTINGVEYKLSAGYWFIPETANVHESERSTWQCFEPHNRGSWYWHLRRVNGYGDPTEAARRRASDVAGETVRLWAATNEPAILAADRETAESDAKGREGKAAEHEAEAARLRAEAALLRDGGKVEYRRNRAGRTEVRVWHPSTPSAWTFSH